MNFDYHKPSSAALAEKGVEDITMPATPYRVWEAMQQAGGA